MSVVTLAALSTGCGAVDAAADAPLPVTTRTAAPTAAEPSATTPRLDATPAPADLADSGQLLGDGLYAASGTTLAAPVGSLAGDVGSGWYATLLISPDADVEDVRELYIAQLHAAGFTVSPDTSGALRAHRVPTPPAGPSQSIPPPATATASSSVVATTHVEVAFEPAHGLVPGHVRIIAIQH